MPVFDDEDDVLDLHESEDEIDTSYDLSRSRHVDKIRRAAIECMDHFFCDKNYWAGGTIAKSRLYKEEHIRVVMEMNIMDAFALAYYCLEHNPPDTIDTGKNGWESDLCYSALDQCRNRWIPKCYIGGIILVFLSLCHGVEFLPTLKKLAEIKSILAQREREEEIKQLMVQQKEDDESRQVETEEIYD